MTKNQAYPQLPVGVSPKGETQIRQQPMTDYGSRSGNVCGRRQKSAEGIVVPIYRDEGPNGAPRGD